MGCCASSDHKPDLCPEDHRRSRSDDTHNSKPPEEETVKEVMSETPTCKPIPKPITPKIEHEIDKNRFVSDLRKLREDVNRGYNVAKRTPLIAADEVSEVSEICSLNDSVSTVTEVRDDDESEHRERVNRSPAKFRNRAPSPGGRRSPARRSEPSPSRVRSTPGRQNTMDGSGRRSRSPATRTVEFGAARSGVGRSPSARKTGKSPARSRAELPEKTQKPEETHSEMSQWLPPTTNESLENPLVSLECFIFL